MNWMAFIATIVQALAWPLVALVLGLVFKAEIKRLLSRPIERIELGPFKANWWRVLAEVESNVELLPGGKGAGPGGPGDTTEARVGPDLARLADTDPPSAVFAAHDLLFHRLQEITGEDYGVDTLPGTVASLARVARERHLISSETQRALEGLTVLRNLAAHGGAGEVIPERAHEYVAQVQAMLYVLAQSKPND